MTITIDTRPYERVHHRKPRQPRFYSVSPWAFEIDGIEKPIFITASYKAALKQVKGMAKYSVTVMP